MTRRSTNPGWLAAGLIVLALLSVAVPASAQDVLAGLDLWVTQNGAKANFSDNPISPGFFPCGAGFSGSINLKGKPIVANKNLGGADTIVGRLQDVPNGNGLTTAVILALSLENKNWVGPCGNTWHVKVRLDPNRTQAPSYVLLRNNGLGGGDFDALVDVRSEVSFSYPGGAVYGTVTDDIQLITNGACWSYVPGSRGSKVAGPVTFDTDCDGVPDFTSPVGTSNFHSGWCPSPSGGAPTWTPIPHDGPHPVGATGGPCVDFQPVPTEPTEPAEPFPGEPQQVPHTEGAVIVIGQPVPACPKTPVIVTQ